MRIRINPDEIKSTLVGFLILIGTGLAIAFEKMPSPEVLVPFLVIVGVAHIMLDPDDIRKQLLAFLKKKLEG